MSEFLYHINERSFTEKGLKLFCHGRLNASLPEWEKEIWLCIWDWLNNDPIQFFTSGSTGKPKEIFHSKKSIEASSKLTAEYFGLDTNNKLLLALPAKYVAGKMMIYRALNLACHLDFVEPISCPQISKQYDFASFVPMQMENMLKRAPDSILKVSKVLLGGAVVRPQLSEHLLKLNTSFYESYGMTETLTHVALRKLGDDAFQGLPAIDFENTEKGLKILAPHISDTWIQTNDLVDMKSKNQFELIGRKDDVINSGGVKIHPSQVEKKLSGLIHSAFYISKKPDEVLGEKVCLFIEGGEMDLPDFSSVLKKFEMPKEVIFMEEFERTISGKVVKA